MLYNESWTAQPPVNSVAGIIAWLETMPADGTYNYRNINGECLMGQYGKSRGADWHDVHSWFYHNDLLFIASGGHITSDWTYGAALKRATKEMKHAVLQP